MNVYKSSGYILGVFLLLAIPFISIGGASADIGRVTVTDVDFSGIVTFETGFTFAGTEVGGLSAITYDANRGVYYVLSDDRSQTNPARYYTVDINISDGFLNDGDVIFSDVTFLRQHTGDLFAPRSVDPEGIALLKQGHIFISTEGDANVSPPIDPFVNRFNPAGKENKALPVPDKFLPDGFETEGVRDNLAFESLAAQPDRKALFTATENALHQDGPASTLTESSPSRVLQYDMSSGQPGPEYVFMVDPIPFDSNPPGIFADNGLVELVALDNYGTFLAMERSFAVGVGNTVVLFEASTEGASDVSGIFALDGSYTPMSKEELADLWYDLGVVPDNLEGMTFGPTLPDGRQSLILVSDNNFRSTQITQFILLAVELETVD